MAAQELWEDVADQAEKLLEDQDYESALGLFKKAQKVFLERKRNGKEEPDFVEIKFRSARCLQKLGRPQEALEIDSEVLHLREKYLKPAAEDVLEAREEVAKDYSFLNAHEIAASLLQHNLRVLESCPDRGVYHGWALRTRFSLAMEFKSSGKYKDALDMLRMIETRMTGTGAPLENKNKNLSAIRNLESLLAKETEEAPKAEPSKKEKAQSVAAISQISDKIKAKSQKQDTPQPQEAVKTKRMNTPASSDHELLKLPGQENLKHMRSFTKNASKPDTSGDGTRSRANSCPPIENGPELEKGFICHNEEGNSSDKNSEKWLRAIENSVHSWLPRAKENDKIRIAILDTGIDLGHPYFSKKHGKGGVGIRRDSVKECKSFLNNKKGDEDANGHGTHAASLLLRLAPNAILYVARVIDDDGEISNFKAVAQAIKHASEKWGVHIISMSLGFKAVPESIELAIGEATRAREVLVFAAASNNGRNDRVPVTYPARSPYVFPVFSASFYGFWQEYNPSHSFKKEFTTLGQNVTGPWTRHGTDETEPYRCRSGTSIATPIMAASAALALQFIYQKPALKVGGFKMRRLKGIDGMALLLLLMKHENDKGEHYYISPEFWLSDEKKAKEKLFNMIRDHYGEAE